MARRAEAFCAAVNNPSEVVLYVLLKPDRNRRRVF